jgi:hypothetical protein
LEVHSGRPPLVQNRGGDILPHPIAPVKIKFIHDDDGEERAASGVQRCDERKYIGVFMIFLIFGIGAAFYF